MCSCVRAGVVNRAMTRACLLALVHMVVRAVRMGARLLTPQAITGRIQRDTCLVAGLEPLGPPDTPAPLVHAPGGPAWI